MRILSLRVRPSTFAGLVAALGFLFLGSSSFSQETGTAETGTADEPQERVSPIEIGRDTTFFTEPLDENGRVDLLAALNEYLKEGVTDENNAAREIFKVVGPGMLSDVPPETFEQLGIDWDEIDEPFLETLDEYVMRKQLGVDDLSEYNQAMVGPWSREACPNIAQWLDDQDEALDRLVVAIQHEKYYVPLVSPGEEGLINIQLDHVQMSRALARTLAARGYAHLHANEIEAAIDDFHSVHMLGRHLSHNATLIEKLVGIAIEGIAYAGDIQILESQQHMRHVYGYFEDQMAKLPATGPMHGSIDVAERLMGIDVVMRMAESNEINKEMFAMIGLPGGVAKLAQSIAMDWNEVLRQMNQKYDEMVEIAQLPREERIERSAEFEQKLEASAKAIATPVGVIQLIASVGSGGNRAEEAFVNVLMGLLAPAVNATQDASHRSETYEELFSLVFALERYREKEGRYPEILDALIPEYLEEVPVDRFSGGALQFDSDGGSYLLYSIGQNGVDDGGRSYFDGVRTDDLRVRIGR